MTAITISPPKRGFTQAWIENKAPLPDSGHVEISDPKSSVRLRCYATGKKVWVGYIRSRSKNGRMNPKAKVLGPAIGRDALAVTQARQKHSDLLALARASENSTVRRTVNDLYIEYAPQARWSVEARKTYDSIYNKWLKDSSLGKAVLSDVTTPDVWRFLKAMSKDVRTHHNKAKSMLTNMFRYAKSNGWCASVPTNDLDLYSLDIIIESKDRALDTNELEEFDTDTPELIAFWTTIEDTGGRPSMNIGYKLLLSLGCRPSELWAARWDEFSIGEDGYPTGEWIIPAARIKNENKAATQGGKTKDCKVILSDLTLTLLKRLRNITGQSEFLFPQTSDEAPIHHSEFSHALAAKFKTNTRAGKPKKDGIAVLGVAQFTPHDLRRSLRTYLATPELDTPPHVAEAVLGHKIKYGVRGVYDRYGLVAERGEALQAFGEFLAKKGLTGE